MRIALTGLAALAAIHVAPGPAAAEGQSFRAEYSVSLLGIPIGSARFDSSFTENSFRINGTLRSSGLARLVDKTDGKTQVAGAIGPRGVRPSTFNIDYVQGKRKGSVAMRFSGDRVASTTVTPKPKKRSEKWVPLSDSHLRATLDPISSTLIRAGNPREVCNRTISFFDGELRGDLRLSHRSTGRIDGFAGDAVTCDARFVPVAGYQKGRKQIDYMRDRGRITISFVQLGKTGFYTPADASFSTPIGPMRVTANRIEVR